jgi:hypothetical protein
MDSFAAYAGLKNSIWIWDTKKFPTDLNNAIGRTLFVNEPLDGNWEKTLHCFDIGDNAASTSIVVTDNTMPFDAGKTYRVRIIARRTASGGYLDFYATKSGTTDYLARIGDGRSMPLNDTLSIHDFTYTPGAVLGDSSRAGFTLLFLCRWVRVAGILIEEIEPATILDTTTFNTNFMRSIRAESTASNLVTAWEAAVATNSGTLNSLSSSLAKNLLTAIELEGLRDKFLYLLPFLGTNIDAFCTPLINASGVSAANKATALGSPSGIDQTDGFAPDGVDDAINTLIRTNHWLSLPTNTIGMGAWLLSAPNNAWLCGGSDGTY